MCLIWCSDSTNGSAVCVIATSRHIITAAIKCIWFNSRDKSWSFKPGCSCTRYKNDYEILDVISRHIDSCCLVLILNLDWQIKVTEDFVKWY